MQEFPASFRPAVSAVNGTQMILTNDAFEYRTNDAFEYRIFESEAIEHIVPCTFQAGRFKVNRDGREVQQSKVSEWISRHLERRNLIAAI